MKNNIKNKYQIIWTHSYKTIGNSKVKILVLPPLDILQWLFRFDEETGKLYRMRGADGKDYNFEVKQLDSNKEYLRINIVDSYSKGAEFLVHRIIYKIKTGVDPDGFVDHIDQNKINNKFDNLRVVDNATNKRNSRMSRRNTSGVNGVYKHSCGKYEARISFNNNDIYLGTFDTLHDAKISRFTAEKVINTLYPDVGFTELHGAAQ
jgi:hypothetical protein